MNSNCTVLKRIGADDTNDHKTINLNSQEFVVGRDERVDHQIKSLRISRKHALFKHDNGNWTVTDLNSVNGICINSKQISSQQPIAINNGDIIRFGPETIEVDFEYVFLCTPKFKELSINTCVKNDQDLLDTRARVMEEFNTLVESELECAICSELFINAVTLNCSHSFCKFCLDLWKSKGHSNCPTCSTKIKTESKSVVLDSFIERIINQLPKSTKELRIQVIKERKTKKSKVAENKPKLKALLGDTSRRQLRKMCHCGNGRNHTVNNCPKREERRAKRNNF